MHTYKNRIAALTIIPSSGGVFEVTVNGALVHSKEATGRFPEEEIISDAVGKAVGA